MREGEAPSYFNPIEAAALVELLEGLLKQHQTKARRPAVVQDDIGVIATYRKQVSNTCLLPPVPASTPVVAAGPCELKLLLYDQSVHLRSMKPHGRLPASACKQQHI